MGTGGSNYVTTDGTFIHYYDNGSTRLLYHLDGTIVEYGAGGSGFRFYPVKITDRNGNYILISYAGANGVGPRLSSIQDTLNRYVYFHYDSNGDLVTITAPGLGASLQVMRFYYKSTDIDLTTSNLFSGATTYLPPSNSAHVLEYVYLGTSSDAGSGTARHTGYKFEYSAYGMIYRTSQSRGMTVSTDSTSSAGSVTNVGDLAAQTTYNYDTTAASLTDVPTYSTRTDEWDGRTTGGSAPAYQFTNNQSTGVSTVTAPDGTVTETHAIVNSGQWDDGLISDTYVKYGSTVWRHTHLDWGHTNNQNPRVSQVRNTESGLTKATVFTYTSYNNVSVVSERGFSTDGTVSNDELRKTETTYVTNSNYLNRYLLHLPETVKIVEGGSTNVISRADFAYDNYGSSHVNMTPRNDIIKHDDAFDPFGSGFVSSTDYRGNVTSVTRYADAATPAGGITHSTTYDIAGNVITQDVDCCQSKSFTYWDYNDSYAYPISVTDGNPNGLHLTRSTEFHYDTGLPATSSDENSQVIEYSYYAASLRLSSVAYPDGGTASYTYSDGVGANAYAVATTKLDSSRNVSSRRYADGRGAVVRTFDYISSNNYVTRDIEYNNLGQVYRVSNPYYGDLGGSVNPDGSWTTNSYDRLGRVTQVTMPRGDENNSLTTSVTTSRWEAAENGLITLR